MNKTIFLGVILVLLVMMFPAVAGEDSLINSDPGGATDLFEIPYPTSSPEIDMIEQRGSGFDEDEFVTQWEFESAGTEPYSGQWTQQTELISDDFESYTTGSYPSGIWHTMFSGSSAKVSEAVAYDGNKAFELIGLSSWARVEYVQLDNIPDVVTYSGAFCLKDNSSGRRLEFGFMEKPVSNKVVMYNCFHFASDCNIIWAGKTAQKVGEWRPNEWYHVTAVVNLTNETADLYINGQLAGDTLDARGKEFKDPTWGTVQLSGKIGLSTGNFAGSGTNTVYMDNIYVSKPVTTSPPAANFTANITSGTAPLTVQFTDTSNGSPTLWDWDFGSGGTSTQQHPTHTYIAAGTYTVSLNVTNTDGSDTHTKSNYITLTEQQQDSDWLVTLDITSGTFTRELTMGVHEAATRGYDVNLDIPSPPDPPGAEKSAYFAIDDTVFTAFSSDYKPPVSDTNPTEVWDLELRSNEPIQVAWDTSSFTAPDIQLTWKNGSVTESMRIVSGTTLPAGTYSVTITAIIGSEMEIAIAGGWNLVSIPYADTAYTLPSPNPIQIIYWYNPTTRMYEVTPMNALVPGRAYWIASTSTFQMGVKGTPISPITTDFATGWNLLGGTDQTVPFSSINIDPTGAWAMPFVYGYNANTRMYEQTTTMQSGHGYWGAVTRDCTIMISTV